MRLRCFSFVFLFALFFSNFAFADAPSDELIRDFENPPDAARPGVYWFFLDGNLTSNGMKADLEAMKRVGIGSAIAMEADLGGPKGGVDYLSADWLERWRQASDEASRLGIELTASVGPGWCGAGGPWIRPEHSMQHLRASETRVVGPVRFDAVLPTPEPRDPFFGRGSLGPCEQDWREFYRDVAVLAFPTPKRRWLLPDWEEKALFFRPPYSSQPGVKPFLTESTDDPGADATVPLAEIVDVSQYLTSDGRLTWDVPEGDWTLLRLGRRLTGQTTRPAPSAGLGLESDKFETTGIDEHFANFDAKLFDVARFSGLHHDSWEMSSQNWSEHFRELFAARRGYDPLRWTPAMFGVPVESVEKTERFLWDLRRTAQELAYENNVLRMKRLGAARGLRFSTEAYDLNPAGDLYLFRCADVPMGEFWARGYGFDSDFSVFEAVSSGRTNGARVVGAESFTTAADKWRQHPGASKRQGDWAFCAGINRLIFHRMCAQPNDDAPGLSLGIHGTHWDRTETWFPLADGYCRYVARVQAVLQRGEPSSDILFLDREGAPTVFVPPTSAFLPGEFKDKREYDFDGCCPQTLIESARAENGKIVFPGGASYSLLVLPRTTTATPELAKKWRELADAGVKIVGERPTRSPSLENYPNADRELNAELDAIWNGPNPPISSETTSKTSGPKRNSLFDANWIWDGAEFANVAPGVRREFVKTFELPASANFRDATVSIAADNAYSLFVNDREIGSGSNFNRPDVYPIADALRPGENRIRVVVDNEGDAPNPAGLIAAVDFGVAFPREQADVSEGDDAAKIAENAENANVVESVESSENAAPSIVSDATWTTSDGRAATVLGAFGIGPWNLAPPPTPVESYPKYEFLAEKLREIGVAPNFESNGDVRWIRKIDGDADVYFVANRRDAAQNVDCVFRVSGKEAQLWNPATGRRYVVDDLREENGRTVLSIRFAPSQSWLVVFRPRFDAAESREFPKTSRLFGATKSEYFDVFNDCSWNVEFDQNAAANRDFEEGRRRIVRFDALQDWSKNADPILRYYSGLGVYETTFDRPREFADVENESKNNVENTESNESNESNESDSPSIADVWTLELGKVCELARVELNGRDLGVVWTAPWEVEIPAGTLLERDNRLKITVANLWCNRLIGDASLPVEQRFTRTSNPQWGPGDEQLLPSGLLGPVRLRRDRAK